MVMERDGLIFILIMQVSKLTQLPDNTTIFIHKLVGKSFGEPAENKDGKELSREEYKKLLDPDDSAKVDTLDGVNFVAYKIIDVSKEEAAKNKALTALKSAKTIA